MSRKEFLGQLERLLWDIPEQERREALDYYNSYFEEAGEENESSVIQELGSPGKVAAMIKADLTEPGGEYGEYTEYGYTDERFREKNMPEANQAGTQREENAREENAGKEAGNSTKENNWDGKRYHGKEETGQNGYDGPYRRAGYTGENRGGGSAGGNYGYYGGGYRRRPRRGSSLALFIIALILTAPVWGGIGLGALGVLIAVVCACIGVLAGLCFGGIGMVIGGIAALVHTIVYQLSAPATALVGIGVSFLLIAVGLLLVTVFAGLLFKVVPVVFRWFIDFIQRLLYRGRNRR